MRSVIYELVRAEVELGICVCSALSARKQGESVSKALGAVKSCKMERRAYKPASGAIHALARRVDDGVE